MTLSIVIVNYNVRFFLEQCLKSVFTALKGIEAEVFVVDNNSTDQSVAMVAQKFPAVKLIANPNNPGFAKANNQAIKKASGKYILLLNPDTVVQENTFSASLNFMKKNPQAGGLGIKMIDGTGQYLPESKRGLPTPWVAFCKIAGLTRLFPKSRRLAHYYMGHLSEKRNQKIEILAGAYMFMRKSALDKIGLLDEDYFMYGEDIDLSYRLLKGGYSNYYLADSEIIHYKGESTKKGSLNYVFVFYKAMVIFARKHFNASYARFFSFFINVAIYLRAGLSIAGRFIKGLWMPLLDSSLLTAGLFYIKNYWENNHRFIQGGEYPSELVQIAFPAYLLLWLGGLVLYGAYDKPVKVSNLFKGLLAGTLAILVVYSLLPEDYRFSRAIIILGAFWAALFLPLWRILLQYLFKQPLLSKENKTMRLLLVGQGKELNRIKALIAESGHSPSFMGIIHPDATEEKDSLGQIENLPALCTIFNITEIIFCSACLPYADILKHMEQLQENNLEIKIAPPQSDFIIGSNSVHAQGQWYGAQFNAITTAANKRAKRLLDFSLAILFLVLSPFLLWMQKRPLRFFTNTIKVLMGQKTWVGYCPQTKPEELPPLKPGVLSPAQAFSQSNFKKESLAKLNQLYAKHYRSQEDFNLIIRHLRDLGG
jgi:GT2 family glycosyltransferase